MTRWLPWLASTALIAVGGGAVYISTVGLQDTQAATLDYISQVAEQTDVSVTSAASGNVTSAASYALTFGSEPSLGEVTSVGGSTWTVDDVLVDVGERVNAGQTLAVADTTEIDDQVADVEASLERARLTLADTEETLDAAPDALQAEIEAAILNVRSLNLQLDQARERRDAAVSGSTTKTQARLDIAGLKTRVADAQSLRDDLRAQRGDGFPEESLAVTEARLAVSDLVGQLSDLQQQAELATIASPVDGIVSEVNISSGYDAPSGSALVVDSGTLEVVAPVVESDIGSLVVGQPATVSIDAVGQEVAGVVTSVVPTSGGTTSSVVTYPVTVTLTDPGTSVLAGMSSDVEIIIDEAAGVVAVPTTALSGTDGSYSVQVIGADGSVESRPVTVGLVSETLAEIQSGLTAGEQVVVGSTSDRTGSADDSSQNALSELGAGDFGGQPPAGGPPQRGLGG